MSLRKVAFRSLVSCLAAMVLLSGAVMAQKKPKASTKSKPSTAKASKSTSSKSSHSSKKDSKSSSKQKATAKKDDKKSKSKKDKATAKRDRDDDRASSKKGSKADRKRESAERRRREAERRAAELAERRRREAAAREARERKLAFERGLRTETVANIAADNTEGEDLNIRRIAVNALGGHAGSVVVMEAQTGKVLTIVNQDWAVRSSIKPCSTIKLVTGVAGVNEGIIDKTDGSIENVTTRRQLDDAVAYSDNGYFQRVGKILGNEKMIEYARDLGLGQPTGINLEGETAGRLAIGNNNARIYSHGDDFEVSTIQLAVMASAITNGGHRVLPRVPRNSTEKVRFQPFYKANVDLPQTNVRRVIPGMMGAAEYGTARRGMDQDLGVAGKTGSCIDKGSWVGLFTSVAPIEQPKYAIAVITRGQSERGRYAAGIAAQIYHALAGTITRTDRNLAQTEFHILPKNVAAAKKVVINDDDSDDSDSLDTMQTQPDGRNVIIVGNAERESAKPEKLVKRTGDSKPLFAPVIITPEEAARQKRERLANPQ
ncbi:MAG TPA: penicillin-binding transpeptidase domain-containing protein [Pyrinomonadaceae bacterium]|nr:penicillin-binding transpeptidase domain-containing protein [Pyrinomonadaceae bacterium]